MFNNEYDLREIDEKYQNYQTVESCMTSWRLEPSEDITNSYVVEVSDDAYVYFQMPNLNAITLLLAKEYKLSSHQIEIIVKLFFNDLFLERESRADVAKIIRMIDVIINKFAERRKKRIEKEKQNAQSELSMQDKMERKRS